MGIIDLILNIFQLILLARVLLSWFPNFDRSNPIIRLIYDDHRTNPGTYPQHAAAKHGLRLKPLDRFPDYRSAQAHLLMGNGCSVYRVRRGDLPGL